MSDTGTVEVIGKADLGYSPHFRCEIRAGEKYTIDPRDYTPELFEPCPGLPLVEGSTVNEQEQDGGGNDE